MNSLYIKNARYISSDSIVEGDIYCEGGIISALGDVAFSVSSETQIIDATGRTIFPGFIDLHTHGAVNVDVNAADEDGIIRMSRFFAAHGVTSFLCSILTDSEEQTLRAIRTICSAAAKTDGARVLGIHLEGPFLSEQYAGAMPHHLLRKGNLSLIERYKMQAEGLIRTITVSPEVPGVTDIIPAITSMGIKVLLGHSNATYEETVAAINAGATGITHTFNAMRLFHQHEPAIMGAALDHDVFCEAICDGLHLVASTVNMLLKCKGIDRVMGITDSIMATGLPDGNYMLGVNPIVVKDGDAMLANAPVRAGSTLTMDRARRNFIKFANISEPDSAKLTSGTAAAFLGMHDIGKIQVGCKADFAVLDEKGTVVKTFVDGITANTIY